MSTVPDDLQREILRRLPAEPLIRFRSVCKAWRTIIDDPHFIKLQFSHQNMGLNILIILKKNSFDKLYYFPLGFLYSSQKNNITIEEAIQVTNLAQSFVPSLLELSPSCDHLFLTRHPETRTHWVLWKDFTGVEGPFQLIPLYDGFEAGSEPGSYATACKGLGYDLATADYKVVRITKFGPKRQGRPREQRTLIYSLKQGRWHRTEDFPGNDSYLANGVFVNGALHWITKVKKGGRYAQCIVALDLSTERYSKIRLPLDIPKGPKRRVLGAMGGFLFVFCVSYGILHGMWILQEYGENRKWTDMVPLTKLALIKGKKFCQRPVAYLKSKEQVLIQIDVGEFIWFDVENKQLGKKVTIKGIDKNYFNQVISGSLDWVIGRSNVAGSSDHAEAGERRCSGTKRKRA